MKNFGQHIGKESKLVFRRNKPKNTFRSSDEDYRFAHYKFAFIELPSILFGDEAPVFVKYLCFEDGQDLFDSFWNQRVPDFRLAPGTIRVENQYSTNNDLHCLVSLPPVNSEGLFAHCLGIHIPEALIEKLFSDVDHFEELNREELGGIRLLFLENAKFDYSIIGESKGPGTHSNLGSGPIPSLENMSLVMQTFCVD